MSQPPNPQPPQPPPTLAASYPGGAFVLFNSIINWQASEKLVAAATLARNGGFDTVHLCINSSGGAPDLAFYVHNVLRALHIRVVTYNLGGVRSAANIIYMAGDERYAAPGSTFFFHETWFEGSSQQNASTVTKRLESIQKDDDRSAALVARISGQPEALVRQWHTGETTLSETEAVKFGVANATKELVIPANAGIDRIIVE